MAMNCNLQISFLKIVYDLIIVPKLLERYIKKIIIPTENVCMCGSFIQFAYFQFFLWNKILFKFQLNFSSSLYAECVYVFLFMHKKCMIIKGKYETRDINFWFSTCINFLPSFSFQFQSFIIIIIIIICYVIENQKMNMILFKREWFSVCVRG